MISTPFETRRYVFWDWDNTLLGVLILPKVIQDVRDFVSFFTAQNFIYHAPKSVDPEGINDLRLTHRYDPWEAERLRLWAEAEARWPHHKVYPEESWYFVQGTNGLELRHALRYLQGERKNGR